MLYLGPLFAHGTIVRHRQVTYRRKKIATIIIATEIKEYKEKKVKKICRHGHLPARLNLPAWPSSQSQFAGMPATAGDLAPMYKSNKQEKTDRWAHVCFPKHDLNVLCMKCCRLIICSVCWGFFCHIYL